MNRKNFLEVAKDFYDEKFKKAKCAFVAGSLVKGTGTLTSDIDLYIVFDVKELPGAYRETVFYQDYLIECFVQNENSLDYFLNQESEYGECVAASMIIEGIVLPQETEYSDKIKAKAGNLYAKGPKILSKGEIDARRYGITDLLDDLSAEDSGELQGTLAVLHQKLGDFYLRAGGQWSGSRKALYQMMKKISPDMAAEFSAAFDAACKNEDFGLLNRVADKILAPFGGRLSAGFKSIAPAEANQGL